MVIERFRISEQCNHLENYSGNAIGTPRITSSPYLIPLISLIPERRSSGAAWTRVLISAE